MIIFYGLSLRRVKNKAVIITNDKVALLNGYTESVIEIKKIKHVTVLENIDGDVLTLKLKTGRKMMFIHGYREMEKIYEIFLQQLDRKLLHIKKTKITFSLFQALLVCAVIWTIIIMTL